MSGHVSRETVAPPAPQVARGVFADTLPRAVEYAELLATEGQLRGLMGPREVPRLWERHLLNCAVVADVIDPGSAIADVGSGAGLPGLVLAIRRPDVSVTLIEPLLRRTTFLDLVVTRMGLTNVAVHRGRAEEWALSAGNQEGFDVVTSRAVAPLDRLASWCLPLVRKDGRMLAMKGSSADEEVASAETVIARLGGGSCEVVRVGGRFLDPPTTLVSIVRSR